MSAPRGTNQGKCVSCHATVYWGITVRGSPIPLDPNPRSDGNLVIRRTSDGAFRVCYVQPNSPSLFPEERFVSHFVSCPNAAEHRKS